MLVKTVDLRKELVKRAKERMIRGDYETAAAELPPIAESLTDDRIQKYADIVKEIKNSDKFVVDPLARMTDKEYFDRLDETAKTVYLLKLSKIYRELLAKL